MNKSTGKKCGICNRLYMLNKNYKAHLPSCELMFKMKTMGHDDFQDNQMTPPSNKELFGMLKLLAQKCERLETELNMLKNNANMRQRKNIIDLLETTRRPMRGFYEWITDIEIDYDLLFYVFKSDLTEGIKHIFTKKMDTTTVRPLCCFKQKTGSIYVYDKMIVNDNILYKWHIINSDEVNKALNYFSYEFIKTYLAWQNENEEKIRTSEEMQEQTIQYMIKINGSKVSNEKRWLDIKKWLFTKIEEDFIGIEF